MTRIRLLASAFAFCVLLTTGGASAQGSSTASLSGKVVHPNKVTQSGDRVLLYDFVAKKWIGPALTDDYGSYAFYGIGAGTYLLSLYVGGKPVWTSKVTIGSSPSQFDIQAPA